MRQKLFPHSHIVSMEYFLKKEIQTNNKDSLYKRANILYFHERFVCSQEEDSSVLR